MRMFLLFILLLCPITTHALVTDEYCHNLDETTCKTTAGCHYDSYNNICRQCSEDHFCTANTTIEANCNERTDGDYPLSFAGAESINDCYKSIPSGNGCTKTDGTSNQNCGLFYPNDIGPKCLNIDTYNYGTNYHMENSQCYANLLQCRFFPNNAACDGEISDKADYDDGEWYINNCRCSNSPFTDETDKFCVGVRINAKPTTQWIHVATDTITYGNTSDEYYCTRCILDNGDNKYYANTTYSHSTQCSSDPTQGHVCKCETSTYYGHYHKGTCNSNTNWGNENNICTKVACDIPGTTTTELLPISNNNSVCTYTANTKLADPIDDFTLGDLERDYGLSVSGWTRIY